MCWYSPIKTTIWIITNYLMNKYDEIIWLQSIIHYGLEELLINRIEVMRQGPFVTINLSILAFSDLVMEQRYAEKIINIQRKELFRLINWFISICFSLADFWHHCFRSFINSFTFRTISIISILNRIIDSTDEHIWCTWQRILKNLLTGVL